MTSYQKYIFVSVVIIVIVFVVYYYSGGNDKESRKDNRKILLKDVGDIEDTNSNVVVNKTYILLTTTSGKIRGERVIVDDVPVNVYLGVQYASAKRFEQSKKKSWNKIRNATESPPSCPQPELLSELSAFKFLSSNYSENCLYLNIFTPGDTPQTSQTSGLWPIIVYVHNGLFSYGGIATDELDGRYFASKYKIIFIAIQYRLGVLGFLNYNHTSHNFGLYDQRLALEWVRDNAVQLGGDEAQVTLVSSGLSSLSVIELGRNKLFQRVIINGGIILSQIKSLTLQFKRFNDKFLKSLPCKKNDLKCLKKIPYDSLLDKHTELSDSLNDTLIGPILDFDQNKFKFQGNLLVNLFSEDDFVLENRHENCHLIKFFDHLSKNVASIKMYKIEEFVSTNDEVAFALGYPLIHSHFEKEEKKLSKLIGSIWSQFAINGNIPNSLESTWVDYNSENRKYLVISSDLQKSVEKFDHSECTENGKETI